MRNTSLIVIGVILFAFSFASPAFSAVNASSAVLRVYRAYLSENADCSSPIVLVDNGDTPQPFDMMTNPKLGEGSIPAKNYRCLIIEMSDHITFIPSADDLPGCTAGTSRDIYVCQTGATTKNPTTGASVSCTGNQSSGEDHVWVYVSRWSSATDGGVSNNAFEPPTSDGDADHGLNLGSDIDVSIGSGSFIFDLTGKVANSGGSCDMSPPKFGFRSGT
jgi:hypothetical protein